MPRVSIILPCWNAADTLPECLDSVRMQTWQDWELVAVNDGSTDATLAVLNEYAARDSRIRVLDLPKVGIVDAPMRGVEMLFGEYLARMDADDVMHPERIAKQVALLDSTPDVAICGTHVWHMGLPAGEGRQRYLDWINAFSDHASINREFFVECPIANPTAMMRREEFDTIGGYQDHGWAEDYDLFMRFLLNGDRFAVVPEPLLGWRHSALRVSMNDDRYSLANFRAVKCHYLKQLYPQVTTAFFQWGAGDVGKQWLREWDRKKPEAVVDINPRKFGKTIHDVPVISPEQLPKPGMAFTVVAVGAPGAREEIREWFESRNYEELRDFLFLA